MRIYIIGSDGITLCGKAPATVNDGEIAVASNEELHAAPSKAILSGDLLCPLIDPNHYHLLEGACIAYVDANTRFPHPDTGHWSIIEAGLAGAGQLTPWIAGQTLQELLVPHGAAPLLPAGDRSAS